MLECFWELIRADFDQSMVKLSKKPWFRTENFVHSSDLVVAVPPPHNSTARLRLYDSANRLLVLQVLIRKKEILTIF
jgi:hypothetical protein